MRKAIFVYPVWISHFILNTRTLIFKLTDRFYTCSGNRLIC